MPAANVATNRPINEQDFTFLIDSLKALTKKEDAAQRSKIHNTIFKALSNTQDLTKRLRLIEILVNQRHIIGIYDLANKVYEIIKDNLNLASLSLAKDILLVLNSVPKNEKKVYAYAQELLVEKFCNSIKNIPKDTALAYVDLFLQPGWSYNSYYAPEILSFILSLPMNERPAIDDLITRINHDYRNTEGVFYSAFKEDLKNNKLGNGDLDNLFNKLHVKRFLPIANLILDDDNKIIFMREWNRLNNGLEDSDIASCTFKSGTKYLSLFEHINDKHFFKLLTQKLNAGFYSKDFHLAVLAFIIEKAKSNPEWQQEILDELLKFKHLYPAFLDNPSLFEQPAYFKQAVENILQKKFSDNYVIAAPKFHGIFYNTSKSSRSFSQPKSNISINSTIISNNDGYRVDTTFNNGNPIKIDNDTPIGYNIYLPDGKINAIMFNVYGGRGELYPPSLKGLSLFSKKLLQNGIMLVELNLIDLLGKDFFQLNMTDDVHTKIHQSIDHMFNIIKHSPDKISQELNIPKNCQIFLEGESFGGRTAIRHAELYPHTFSGYISHDGTLDLAKLGKTSRPNVRRDLTFTPIIDPANNIKKIMDPLLILQNQDDNNVNAKTAYSFTKKANALGKSKYIHFHPSKVGSRINTQKSKDITNKGHYAPSYKKEFDHYLAATLSFMQNPSELTATDITHAEFKQFYENKIANKFHPRAATEKLFFAEALQILLSNHHYYQMILDDAIWTNHYQPVLDAVFYCDHICSQPAAIFADAIKHIQDKLSNWQLGPAFAKNMEAYFQFVAESTRLEMPCNQQDMLIKDNPHIIKMLQKCVANLKNDNDQHRLETKRFLRLICSDTPEILPQDWQMALSEDMKFKYKAAREEFISVLDTLKEKMPNPIDNSKKHSKEFQSMVTLMANESENSLGKGGLARKVKSKHLRKS